MRSAVHIRALRPDDLASITELHLLAFPKAALSALGQEAVRRYYQWQLEHQPDMYATVALIDGALAGFSLAGQFRHPLSGFLRAHRGYLIRNTLRRPWLLANPIFFDRVRLGLKKLRPRRRRGNIATGAPVRRFGVLSLAVHPGFQGHGVGQALMDDAEREARRLGVPRIGLTVRLDNKHAIHFYESHGWYRDVDQHGRWTGAMHKDLPLTSHDGDASTLASA